MSGADVVVPVVRRWAARVVCGVDRLVERVFGEPPMPAMPAMLSGWQPAPAVPAVEMREMVDRLGAKRCPSCDHRLAVHDRSGCRLLIGAGVLAEQVGMISDVCRCEVPQQTLRDVMIVTE